MTQIATQTQFTACLADEFAPIKAKVHELAVEAGKIVVTDATQLTEMKAARAMRLTLKDLRCKVENRRKELKADLLEGGRRIDAAANAIKGLIEPLEQQMEHAETFAARAEQARKDALRKTRGEALIPLGVNVMLLRLEDMTEEEYQSTLEGAKAAHQARLDRETAERLERERAAQAEQEERRRLAAENARLRKERDEAEAKAAQERANYLAELAERQAAEDAREAAAEAERKAQIAAERKAARAPDKSKLTAYALGIEELAKNPPKVKDPESAAILADTLQILKTAASRLRQRLHNLE